MTDKEKEAAKDAIQKAAELAKSKIDNSDDNSAVDTAKTQGIGIPLDNLDQIVSSFEFGIRVR